MRSVLVPVDGTDLAASIIPDARRLAGQRGELILIRDASNASQSLNPRTDAGPTGIQLAESYVDQLARTLRAAGVAVKSQVFVMGNVESAIAEAIHLFQPDYVAAATHGRNVVGRLMHGSVAWRVLSSSPVPMLLRHVSEPIDPAAAPADTARRIMVPLDGSKLAEAALPLARKLATEWRASLCLARIVPNSRLIGAMAAGVAHTASVGGQEEALEEARIYLEHIAHTMPGPVYRTFTSGAPAERLIELVEEWGVTDIVMASHGRTGLSRMIMGSVADALIHHLHCPIIVVPALVPAKVSAAEAARANPHVAMLA